MNPLSAFAAGLGALASTGKKSSYSDPSTEQDPAQDQFARMLNPANTPNHAPPQAPERVPAKPPAAKSSQPDKNRADDEQGDDAPGDATKRPRAQDGDAKAAQPAKEAAAKDSSTTTATGKDATAGKDSKDAPADATVATEAGWPPAGLGGFGMSLLAQAVPGGDALAAAAAALAASMANAAGATPTATAVPTDATAPATTAAATGVTALPSLGALAPAAAVAKPTSTTAVSGDAQAAALMSMAVKALDPADDGTAPDAPDAPAFVLPTAAPTLTRLQDPAPIFAASPTPTPEMGSDTFDDAIGARLSWLADQKIGHAHIKVTPNEMGPVEVRLHLEGDKVNASFTAANADTRQALEQSLPRLREMLGQNGFQLGQADVGQQQQGQTGNRNGSGRDGNGLTLDDSPPVGIPSVVLRQRGLLDAYA
ncbi:flagellar hook-length control protein FliK [Xanthomonas vesicatoria]|uniref:Flagellar hook-length control protein FliK n=3 Tax=Xanthomonas vesicatoria TaxID=56460 RepID=A0ABS8L6Y1_9XANT|nr:flagellar hook-length control protein FliK [Xanthomonas vesicatoria]APO93847.1 flagellar protein [Xanthomonas vesicatoria]KHM95532.1 flagellar protein [Xanthomonas vesicatoria]MCC8620975.1 flagellar hook-length control protein FliK [Xanthomonas vesicatoria]MCC8695104.1 flagellar hook-length control protein FliK [Xanthomonas vesicatoria]MCC8702476.1 flagellar hook-length control protein FliK [Xanthomonas vesicatoria]